MDDINLIEVIEAIRETLREQVCELDAVLSSIVRADYRTASPARLQECLAELVMGLDSCKPHELRQIGLKIGLAEALAPAGSVGGGSRSASWVIQERPFRGTQEVEIDAKLGQALRYLSLPASSNSDFERYMSGEGLDASRDPADYAPIVPQTIPSRFGLELSRCISLRRALNCVKNRLPCLKGLDMYRFLASIGFPVVVPTPDVLRFARYISLISPDETNALEHYIGKTERAARLCGMPVAQLGYMLELYAGSATASDMETICPAKKPHCEKCRLTERCQHYPVMAAAAAAKAAVVRGKPIHEWNVDERPRERLLAGERLSNSELLALILRSGSGRLSAVELGRELIHEFGTLHDLERAGPLEIVERMRGKGIGPAKAAEICAAIELGKRVCQPAADTRLGLKQIGSSRDIFELCRPRYKSATQEEFLLLILNTKNRLQKEVPVSLGTLNSSIVHPRDVFRHALREAAAAVIFVHNHPSGDPQPSDEDILLTARLADAGKLLGIQVLDHVIIGSHEWYSFADHGRMK